MIFKIFDREAYESFGYNGLQPAWDPKTDFCDGYNFTCSNTRVAITWYRNFHKERILEWKRDKVKIGRRYYYVCKT